MNPITGEKVWDYAMLDISMSGILTTASDVLFSGNGEGCFFALNARSGKHYVSIADGHGLFTFGLPDARP